MLERLTDEALQAVADAKAIARELRHDRVDAPHVLLGILRAGDATTGGATLVRAGLRYEKVRAAVAQDRRAADREQRGHGALTLQAKKLLELALNEAQMDGRATVTTTHLALACSCREQLPGLAPPLGGRGPAIRGLAGASLGRVPVERLAQRREALARANIVRARRATLKKDLKNGRAEIGAIISDPPDCAQSAKLFDLLLAVPTFGRVKADKVLAHARISPSKSIGGLSERQRDDLVCGCCDGELG